MINSDDQYTSIIEEQSSNGTDEVAALSSPNPNDLTSKQHEEGKDEEENPYGYRQPSPVVLGTNPEPYISFTSAENVNRKAEASAMPEEIEDEEGEDDMSLSVIEIERQDSR